jgi:hypothetical protein
MQIVCASWLVPYFQIAPPSIYKVESCPAIVGDPNMEFFGVFKSPTRAKVLPKANDGWE